VEPEIVEARAGRVVERLATPTLAAITEMRL
jgi:hypothetical protein